MDWSYSKELHTRTLTAAGWEKYSKYHRFLGTTRQAKTVKWKLSQLNGLAIAQQHSSCPV